MRLWCITGLDSPKWIENIWSNYQRQKDFCDVKLIVVENGKGIGHWHKSDSIVVSSDTGAAAYINAGISKARELADPGDWIVKLDSDDYYGFGRLSHIHTLSKLGYKAAGAASIFVKRADNILLRVDAKTTPFKTIPDDLMPHGPTLAAQIDYCLDFPNPAEKWGEDALWVESMRKSGIEFGSFPLSGFCYMRHSDRDHTFPLADNHIRHIWSADTYDEGIFDLDVVNGNRAFGSTLIPHNPMIMMDAMESLWKIHNNM